MCEKEKMTKNAKIHTIRDDTKHEEILHMPPQFLWTEVTSEAIIYP